MKIHSSRAGFTLIELLVVISIILIASSVIFIGGSGGDGAKLTSAQRILSGIAQGARGQAILKGQRVRLIIYDDVGNKDDEKKLRFLGLVYEQEAGTNEWIAATQGTYLPDGIYFNKTLSNKNGWSSSNTMRLEYPRAVAKPEGSGETFNYYEFNSNGTIAAGFANDWLVLQAGSLRPAGSGSELAVDFDDDDKAGLKAALIFRRAGSTTPVNDPSEIQ
ncbi:MAG: pilus assembly FimT family protein [Opitutaceae bacterium]